MDQVLIFDTTLRDGEQSPGISLDVVEKLEIADSSRASVSMSSRPGSRSRATVTSSRSRPSAKGGAGVRSSPACRARGFGDVDRAWEAVRHAQRPRIHIFIATSAIPHGEESSG